MMVIKVAHNDELFINNTLLDRHYHLDENVHARMLHEVKTSADNDSSLSLIFTLAQESELSYTILITGDGNCTLDIIVEMQGPQAKATIKGAYALYNNGNVTITTVQRHTMPHTTSELRINGALCDNAQVYYQGLIHIAPIAQNSVALQENKTLLLSSAAKAVSVPSLEVLANQVHCAHGSAMASLDAESMNYLFSRGIIEKDSKRILIEGFFAQYLNEYTNFKEFCAPLIKG